jgi:RNA polymerase sigma-70 factor (ECF subfamily)
MNRPEKLIEQVLILRCQIGDKEAFAELIERNGRALRYFIDRLTDNSETAEDIYQDTWLTVVRRIYSLKHADAFPAWLYRIARNKAFEQLRRKKVFISPDENTAIQNGIEDDTFTAEDSAKIHTALEKLNPVHKEVLMLRFLEQMPYDQIAMVTGCNIGTVKSRIYYAKLALKKEMER